MKDEFNNHDDFIKDIVSYVPYYKWIITEVVGDCIATDPKKDKTIKELLRNIFHDIKTEAFKPLVLGILEYHQDSTKTLNDDNLIVILETIRTYLIRRRILDLTKGDNKGIPLFVKIESLSKAEVTMFDLLTNFFYELRLPNDREVTERLTSMNFYELKRYSKLILGKIEEHNAKVAVDFRNKDITIEHIMPQTLSDSWKEELGENYDEIHKNYLHNIGNLILTEFNSEIGNKPFKEKKIKLESSSLKYRLDIIDNNIWNENSIKAHQATMIKRFLATFPLPEELREEDNYNTRHCN